MSESKGYLTTHVLDTANGCPGKGISMALYRIEDTMQLITKRVTNDDGRCDEPILQGADFKVGKYELVFNVADYFAQRGHQLPAPAFLDDIVLRFSIADLNEHYHVPLLVSPFSYSTYKGS